MGKNIFICNRCGKCCERLNLSSMYSDLDDGFGVCIYFNKKTRNCTIYRRRPIKCNIQLGYEKYYKNKMSYKMFIQLNYEGCRKLSG